ncbi:YkvA family protein [Pontibacter chitinilyticus]|uniref:YkvA family protein n=1 Tax=Pontibacter chitinilyticus TaxID=2674989 RepID=UPI0032191278
MLRRWKETVRKLKEDIYTLYLAANDPRIPFGAKVVLVLTVAYAFSPIDLIPDFIPLIGYLDDLVLLPLGIWLCLKLIPDEVLVEYRAKAREQLQERKPNYVMATFILILWLLLGYWIYRIWVARLD